MTSNSIQAHDGWTRVNLGNEVIILDNRNFLFFHNLAAHGSHATPVDLANLFDGACFVDWRCIFEDVSFGFSNLGARCRPIYS